MIQSLATVLAGLIAGLVIVWKIGLVGLGKFSINFLGQVLTCLIACMPILFSVGYSRLVVVMLKDKRNKQEHAQSAQIACESAGAIRTVAALTREDGCLEEYRSSLKQPLQRAIRFGAWSTMVYAASQASMFFVIALVFWFGAKLFSNLEITVFQLFVGLMVSLVLSLPIKEIISLSGRALR
jgi:ATP-binding cassette subfamily B (MDR/TAP) protein 1